MKRNRNGKKQALLYKIRTQTGDNVAHEKLIQMSVAKKQKVVIYLIMGKNSFHE